VKRGRGKRPRVGRWKIGGLAVLVAVLLGWRIYQWRQPGPWQRVFATREGQIGDVTATRLRIRSDSRFVALPHPKALGKTVEIRHGDRAVVAKVLDVGPWNVDDAYWERGERPASERGRGAFRKPVNLAGIDLSDPVFAELGMQDNDYVEWRFVHSDFTVLPRL